MKQKLKPFEPSWKMKKTKYHDSSREQFLADPKVIYAFANCRCTYSRSTHGDDFYISRLASTDLEGVNDKAILWKPWRSLMERSDTRTRWDFTSRQ